jgi:hypothetical protein
MMGNERTRSKDDQGALREWRDQRDADCREEHWITARASGVLREVSRQR